MDSLKSGKLAMHFIYQGIEFQMNVTKHFIDLFSKYLALIFGTQKSDFERNCVEFKNFRREAMFYFKHFYL